MKPDTNLPRTLIAAALFAMGATSMPVIAATGDDADIKARVNAAQAASGDFLKQLGAAMQREMQAGGPVAAMKVCREVAPPP